MTHQQDGNASSKPTDYPEINIFGYSKNREDAVSYAKELLTKFVPRDIWPSTTIMLMEESGGSFAIHVTTASSDT